MIKYITLQFGDYSEHFGFAPEQHETADEFLNMIERVLVDDYEDWQDDDEISFTIVGPGECTSGMTYRADQHSIIAVLYGVLTRLIEEAQC